MNDYKVVRVLLFSSILGLCVLLPILLYSRSGDVFFTAVCAVFCVCIALLSFGVSFNEARRTREIVSSLSELIACIGSLREEEIFPETEDTLLSKLQSQVTKLTHILQVQKKEANREKEEIKSMISDISHQLKTPVAALKMYGEFIMDPAITQKEREEYLAVMAHALDKLTFLTDSMIKMTRLESGIIRLHPVSRPLEQTILDAIMLAYQKAKAIGAEIRFDPPSSPIDVLHDPKWTAEAIYNLLDNALKYGSPGGVITLTLTSYEMFARLDVKNEGTPIPEEEQAKLFSRFYRGKNAREKEGVGIGLYLTRQVLNGEGGYIRVSSDKAHNVFSVFLPR